MAPVDAFAELERLELAAATARANLVDLEQDPTRVLLEYATLTGVSADRWRSAHETLDRLWQWMAALAATLERARDVCAKRRGPRRVAELTEVVLGPSIELDSTIVDLPDRGLFQTAAHTRRCTPRELLAQMAASFDGVKALIVAARVAWDTLVPRLAAARVSVNELADAARELGVEPKDDLEQRLFVLSETLLTDPVSVSEADIAAIEASVTARQHEVDAARHLRDELDDRLTHARSVLRDVEQAHDRAEQLQREVNAKIAPPVQPLGAGTDLSGVLDDVAARAASGEWLAAASALDECIDHAVAARRQADETVSTCRALLEQRNQLRGLLDALRAKAAKWRLLEDEQLAAAYERAHDVLYTAPTDLTTATDLVQAYQRQLAESVDRKKSGS